MSSRHSDRPDRRDRDRDRDRERRRSRSPSSRRRGSPSRREHRRDSSPRREKDSGALPSSFDREPRESRNDQRNVLERMDKACDSMPMEVLLKCVRQNYKIKVWTRNYKEVRGICSGYITYFDKHWNMIMKDVEEIFLRPKKGKTPYLLPINDPDTIPEAKPKTPKVKKPAATTAEVIKIEPDEPQPIAAEGTVAEEGKKKKKRRKRKKSKMDKRTAVHLFLRGDNIVMIAVCEDEEEAEEENNNDDDDEPVIIENN